MVKSVIIIVSAVFLLVIDTMILILKPDYDYSNTNEDNYAVIYQKWIKDSIFVFTVIITIFTIYFSVELHHLTGKILLSLECLLVIIYALCKYKGIYVDNDNIRVKRLFRKDLLLTFSDISKVIYEPNARITVKYKRKDSFDISVNSENFYKFYSDLINKEVKFKTNHIPIGNTKVYVSLYDMTIIFPKTMFREFYQNKYYLRNSKYLFSGRSLDNQEYIEAYIKNSNKDIKEFTNIIKDDLEYNGFKPSKVDNKNINDFEFVTIKAKNINKKKYGRTAFIYQGIKEYLVLYTDYLLENEESFMRKISNAIRPSKKEERNNKLIRI